MMPGVPKSQIVAIQDRMQSGGRMSWDEVLWWARSGDVELMGAAFGALLKSHLIDGVIDGHEADSFIVTYLIMVMEGRGVAAEVFEMSPYEAAHELVRWYKHWRGQSPPNDCLKQARDELSRLYRSGDEAQRRRVIDGALEHIFEDPSCRADFEHWKDDSLLARGHQEAMEWIQKRP